MIKIEEIRKEDLQEFWDKHINYLIEDEIIEEDDIDYFQSEEYRGVLEEYMKREDKQYFAYFKENGKRIGAVSYCMYKTEDDKCFILDFWIFKEYRNNNLGHLCFYELEKLTKKAGAKYYEINSEKEESIRFWKSLGFEENGVDEWGMKLFIKK